MNDILNKKVGDKERTSLEAKPVVLKSVEIRIPKEGSKAQIAVFNCEHPDCKAILGQDTIEISQVKMENMKTHKLECVGLWINLDKEENLQKGSVTADFLKFIGANSLSECVGKTLSTVLRDNGFLAFKGIY